MASTSISGVGTINSAGIGSGLDVNSIVTQLMAIESQPLTRLQQQASTLQTELSVYGSMKSQFSALGDATGALLSPALWSATRATSDDPGAIAVASASNAQTGSYAVSVNALASSQTLTSTAVPAASTTVGTGTLTIELGSWSGTPPSAFAPKNGATPVSVTIGPADATLGGIRDKINASGAGVVASIVVDASGARLSLRSKDTGVENGFRVTATESAADGVAGTGLSMLGYDPSAGVSQLALAQSASNASATINGIAVTSASNTLANLVDGLTLTLQRTTAAPVNIGVTADTDAIRSAISGFVTAFNGLAGFIRTQTAYDATSKSGGTLQGDQSTLSLQRQLRGVINQPSSASAMWSTLSAIGITMQADGTLATDATKLGAALGNLPELHKLMCTDGADAGSSGFIRRFDRIATAALGVGGMFDSMSTGINDSLKRNSQAQSDMQDRLAATEARMRAQYTALDTQMSQLNGLSSYISQQISLMNKSNN
jgi:flagellar hook-associated protein 2